MGNNKYSGMVEPYLFKPCTFSGCTNKLIAKGYCHTHYKQWKRDLIPASTWTPTKGKCQFPSCDEDASWRHLCRSHYEKARKGTIQYDLGFPEYEIENCTNPQNVQGLCYNHNITRKRYKLDKEAYIEMLSDAICGNIACGSTYRLHVDHDHATGLVRGWLCSDCNTALGLLKDDPEKIAGLIRYMENS